MSAADGLVYNRQRQTPEVSLVSDGENLTQGVDFSTTYTNNVNAGTKTASVTVTGKGRYYGSHTYKFSIATRDISTLETTDTNLTYNGVQQTVSPEHVYATGIELTNTSKVTEYTITGNAAKDSNAKAGNEKYTLEVKGTGNFSGTLTKDWTIAQKDITGSSVELSASELVYNGQDQNVTVTSVTTPTWYGADKSDKAIAANEEYTVSGETTGNHVRTDLNNYYYVVSVSGTGNFCGTQTASWRVTPADISAATVSLAQTDFTYDSNSHYPTVSSASLFHELNQERTDYTTNQSGEQKTDSCAKAEVDNYTMTLTGTGDYTGTKVMNWKINQASLGTLTLKGGTYTFNGGSQTNAVASVKSSNNLTLDTSEYSISGNSGTNAGGYTAYATGVGNFTGTTPGVSWSIGKATLDTIEISGNGTYTGKTQNPTFTVKGNGATATLNTDYKLSGVQSATNAGTYKVTASATSGSTNFQGNVVDKQWTINPASITGVSATATTYNGSEQTATLTVSGGVNGETPTVIPSNNKQTNAGTYTNVTVTGTGNYTGTKTCSWTINKYNLSNATVTSEAKTYEYNNGATITYDGTKSCTATGVTFHDNDISWSGTSGTATGSYKPKASAGSSGNTTGSKESSTAWTIKQTKLVPGTTDKYWLAAPDLDNPEKATTFVNQAQIDSDIAEIKKDPNGDIATKWKGYMNNETYHLYTRWNGSDKGTGKNQWVEFRIIEVGSHDDDGSGVTFMATHALPSPKMIYNFGDNTCEWSGSSMFNIMNTSGGYAYDGMSDLVNSNNVLSVMKYQATRNSATNSWNKKAYKVKNSKFWLISATEIVGEHSKYTDRYVVEGTQYTWFKNNQATDEYGYLYFDKLGEVGMSRSKEALDYSGSTIIRAYTRSPFLGVDGDGTKYWGLLNSASYHTDKRARMGTTVSDSWVGYGIVPCFCF